MKTIDYKKSFIRGAFKKLSRKFLKSSFLVSVPNWQKIILKNQEFERKVLITFHPIYGDGGYEHVGTFPKLQYSSFSKLP